MSSMAMQLKVNRVVTGTKIPHPCGDPNLPTEADRALRRAIIQCSLSALQREVKGPTLFVPDVTFTSG